MPAVEQTVERVKEIDVDKYKYGFSTDIESVRAPKGLSEDIVRFISAKKGEPGWLLDWRLEAYRRWRTMQEPTWAKVHYPKIDFDDLYYYAAPKSTEGPKSLDEVDPELLRTYEKLGIPLKEQEVLAGVQGAPKVAVDAVFDSVSVVTTFKEELAKAGVIFCSISEAVRTHPELVKKYLGSVVPITDNFYATLNSAVFSDGSFVYVPEGVRCPMELSTYFRINAENTGQFERTLIIADKGAYVSYLEGCTAPMRDENQLHAAVVELVALDDAEIKYSTVQNWYPGDAEGKGGVYNFVTKRGDCRGDRSKISWTQVETGSAITWKYPSCILRGHGSRGEFYSIAISNGYQQVDSGTKMIHLGRDTSSRIISKGIAAGFSDNTYRGLVSAHRKATNARNFTCCDSLLIGDKCGAHTVPYIEAKNASATFEHEATTSKISDDQLFYCLSRGLSEEEAVALIVNGFVRDVLQQLPMEFMAETQKLIGISLEGSVG
ncbi:MAG: Fe-S cluster assembly protein SufB [Methyloceanibacter sp.]|uniref:Fe-S cluster assembly protein SufB n=2 Tax=Methyloceanibacter sp. TaxID=1965321 RepID=UPI001DA3F136|nr:Fe-S cluster assembly protein SufB [Methyloceanibacter sp.]MCB1443583.1 Fe-S cluster assembly protein SufB [Methyloceanibacter sp.]MCC0058301.1 Fe-S cluster assembly protein SufB [Hyphomicrobiaceae bacterium]